MHNQTPLYERYERASTHNTSTYEHLYTQRFYKLMSLHPAITDADISFLVIKTID